MIVFKRLTKRICDFSINSLIKVIELVFAEIRSTERHLQSKTVENVQLFPNGYTGRSLSLLLNLETAIFELKNRAVELH